MREIIRYLSSDLDRPFAVEMAGTSYCDGTYRIKREKSAIWVFEYILSGSGQVREQSRSFRAGKGDVYILHRGRDHEYSADARDPWVKIWFNISGPVVENLLGAYDLQAVNHIPGCPDVLEILFREFLAATRTNDNLDTIFTECALIFHQIMIRLADLRPSAPVPGEAEIMRDFINHNLTSPVSLQDMASRIFRSKAYAIRIFRTTYGQTPYAYLIQRRVEAARHLLRETRMTVAEIADQFCFADQHYFANVFRQYTGLPPSQFRKHKDCENIKQQLN